MTNKRATKQGFKAVMEGVYKKYLNANKQDIHVILTDYGRVNEQGEHTFPSVSVKTSSQDNFIDLVTNNSEQLDMIAAIGNKDNPNTAIHVAANAGVMLVTEGKKTLPYKALECIEFPAQ